MEEVLKALLNEINIFSIFGPLQYQCTLTFNYLAIYKMYFAKYICFLISVTYFKVETLKLKLESIYFPEFASFGDVVVFMH